MSQRIKSLTKVLKSTIKRTNKALERFQKLQDQADEACEAYHNMETRLNKIRWMITVAKENAK